MSVEAHKCNVPTCKGYIVFENADFNYNNPPTVEGMYEFDSPSCTECGKEYKVVPYHVVIGFDENGDVEEVESVCITKYEKREKERKFKAEPNPHTKILLFLEERRYTYSVTDVLNGYQKQEQGSYVSHTMKDCIKNLKDEIKALMAH